MIQNFQKLGPAAGLLVVIALAFIFGGSSRAETTSMIFLRPIAVLALVASILVLPKAAWQSNRALISCAIAWMVLSLIHLIPLPPVIWQALPGRQLAASIDMAAGISVWRPLSIVPWQTVLSTIALALPLAAFLLTLTIPSDRAMPVVMLLLTLVLISAIFGLLQVIGGKGNPFYLYAVTNADSAVGLFANRNHNAIFLATGFPLISAAVAMYRGPVETQRTREIVALGSGMLLIPFLITTQSRAGLLLGLFGIVLAFWVYRTPAASLQKRRPQNRTDPRLILAGMFASALVVLTVVFSATNAIERLGRLSNEDDELRFQVWPTIAKLSWEFFPFGSGMGTFVEVYGSVEPVRLLQPAYLNHAHNDWLEIALTGGLPFLLLIVVAAIITTRRGVGILRSKNSIERQVLARLGFSICLILLLGSVYDYPLRTPSLALLFSIAAAFWAGQLNSKRGKTR